MAENETTRACPQCGNPLPGDAPQGLCPQCLLKNGLASEANTTPTYPRAGSAGGSRASYRGPGRFIPPSVAELGPLFPQMEILELLGQGGMGAVYKAKQRGLDRLVAVKILPPDLGEIPGFADRFTREARALAKLNHPNIVSVFDFGRTTGESGLYYLVMEYIDGVNLRQAMRAKSMTPPEALAIVPQVCEALQFAHDEGIVHRDIKPENILIDKRGKVKIADFGLAKLVAGGPEDVTLTREGGTMGTPHYMAPEQIEGAHAVDHRADIYSLGVVFYEMLTGELPLGRFAAPSKKVKIDVRLDEIVLRTLEKEPELRYQHASEVKTQVDGIRGMSPAAVQRAFGSEFKSKATVLGIPLLHIAFGLDPKTGRKRVAKGIIAIGDIAVGVLAMGGAAFGGLAFGGIGIGLISISGVAIALLMATGGIAIGSFAFGGLAIGGIALGGCAVGLYTWGGASFGIHDLARDPSPAWITDIVDTQSNQWARWLTMLSIAVPVVGLLLFLFIWVVFYMQKASGGDGKPTDGDGAVRRREEQGDEIAQARDVHRLTTPPAIAMCLVAPLYLFLAVLCGFNGIDIADGNDSTPAVQGYLLIGVAFASLLVFALVLRGAWHMFSVTRHGAAVLAGFLTFPIGIWAVAVLGRRDVRDAFAEAQRKDDRLSARPIAVPFFGVVNILFGFATLFMVVLVATPAAEKDPMDQLWDQATPALDLVRTAERVMLPFQYLSAALLVAAGIGLLMWKPWGRKLAIGVCVYLLLDFLVQVPILVLSGIVPVWRLASNPQYSATPEEGFAMAVVVSVVGLALALAILAYLIVQLVVLNRPRVIEAFAANTKQSSGSSVAMDVRIEAPGGFVCAIIAIVCLLVGLLGPLVVVALWPERSMTAAVALFAGGLVLAVVFGLLGHRHRMGRFTALAALVLGLGLPGFFYLSKSQTGPSSPHTSGSVTYLDGHTSIAKGVAVSRDGKFLASVGMDGRLIIRELPGGNIRTDVRTSAVRSDRPDSPLYSVAFTPNGEVLAGGNPESVSVLKATPESGEAQSIAAPTRGPVRGIMWFDRGRKLAYVAGDTEVVFYDPQEQRATARAPIYPNKAFGNVRAVAGSPDGRFIAVTSSNMSGDGAGGAQSIEPCVITVYETTGEQRLSFRIDTYAEFSYAQIVFTDARTLVMCLPSGSMRKWTLGNDDEWSLVASPKISPGRYTAIAASNDGKTIWLAHNDEIVGIDSQTGEGIAFAQLDPGKRAKEFASFPIEAIVPTGEPLTVAAALWNGKVAIARCVSLEENRQPRPQVGGNTTLPALEKIEPDHKVGEKDSATTPPVPATRKLPTLEQMLGKWEAAKTLHNQATRGPAMAAVAIEASNGVASLDPDLTTQLCEEMLREVTDKVLLDDTFVTCAANLARRGHPAAATKVAKQIAENGKREAALADIVSAKVNP